MKKISLIILISSLLMLLAACIGWGFYDKIMQSGFDPFVLLLVGTLLSISGLIGGFTFFMAEIDS